MTKTPFEPPLETPENVFQCNPEQHNQRIDAFLSLVCPHYSRTFFRGLIDQSLVSCNQTIVIKSHQRVKEGDQVAFYLPPTPTVSSEAMSAARALPLQVLFEHQEFLILEKPAGISVHKPHAEHPEAAVADWLVAHYPEAASVGKPERPGIVHRLDKNTSGLLIVARTHNAFTLLTTLFKERAVQKEYVGLALGKPKECGSIRYQLLRHPTIPTQMTHGLSGGREAFTAYETVEYFTQAALVTFRPTTGRTHQIRVHCAAIGHPLLADIPYGTLSPFIQRHALHASALRFTFEGTEYSFTSPLPNDMEEACKKLRDTGSKSEVDRALSS
jgi:23S rRNA pseudouridine1911/1915/1917 synthase